MLEAKGADFKIDYTHRPYLQVGRLLETKITRSWSIAEKQNADDHERRCCFFSFTDVDEGRGREFCAIFSTPAEALLFCREWNHNFKSLLSHCPTIPGTVHEMIDCIMRHIDECH